MTTSGAGSPDPALKTVGALVLLLLALPGNVLLTIVALVRGVWVKPRRRLAADPRTIMVSGGKMTKALQLARSFHESGHRVILVESTKYRLTGHRFSNSVAQFHTVPAPDAVGYLEALRDVVTSEGVDVYVPVCSPVASQYDALSKRFLAAYCDVLTADPEVVTTLDDKYQFSALATKLGLSVPDFHLITSPQQVVDFDFRSKAETYVLKSIAYDPVHRLDLTQLPLPSPAETLAFVQALPISVSNPWIMQAFIPGQEYCTHSTVREGIVQAHCCCTSSPFQVNYEMVQQPEITEWVTRFVKALDLTGQVSFDFIRADDGRVYAIECNPRTHSAITMFYDHPDLAAAYLESGRSRIEPLAASRPTYWLYHELWRLMADPASFPERLRTVLRGKEAIFSWSDPLPFLMAHHVQMPWLLLQNLRHRKAWIRIDFNIGKLVEAAGD